MKTFLPILICLLVLLFNSTMAQIPPYISQQGFLADSAGNLVTGNYHLEFLFYSDSIGGSALLTIDQPSVSVVNGIYNTNLRVDDTTCWKSSSWLQVSVNGEVTSPRIRVTSVPYAFTSQSLLGLGSTATGIGSNASGKDNVVSSDYSFTGGRRAKALHTGSFVWADSTDADFASTQPNQFNIRAGNGVRLASDAGAAKTISIGERYRDNGIVAWGKVAADGSIPATAKFGVASVVRNSAGNYTVTLDVTALDHSLIVVANAEIDTAPTGASTARVVMVNQLAARNNFDVYIMNGTYTMVDNDFVFIVTAR